MNLATLVCNQYYNKEVCRCPNFTVVFDDENDTCMICMKCGKPYKFEDILNARKEAKKEFTESIITERVNQLENKGFLSKIIGAPKEKQPEKPFSVTCSKCKKTKSFDTMQEASDYNCECKK